MNKSIIVHVVLSALCVVLIAMDHSSLLAQDPGSKAGTGGIAGWVADEKCGAKGANDKAEACTKKCLAAGAKTVIVTDKDQKVLSVDNPDALKGHEGHHVAVQGTVKGDSIHVESVKML